MHRVVQVLGKLGVALFGRVCLFYVNVISGFPVFVIIVLFVCDYVIARFCFLGASSNGNIKDLRPHPNAGQANTDCAGRLIVPDECSMASSSGSGSSSKSSAAGRSGGHLYIHYVMLFLLCCSGQK